MAHTTEHAMEQVDVIDGQSPAEEGNSRREELKELMLQGLWKNNPSLVQVLGLCPTLAVSSTFTNALGLGLATMVVLISSNLAISLVRNWVPKDIRIPVYVMIIAALVTSVQLLMNAYTYGLYQALGIFIAVVVLAGAGVTLGRDYPQPVVDHGEARTAALAALKSIRV